MIYNVYINLKKFKNNLFSNFLKSLISFFIRSKSKIISIIDFGNFYNKKKINRIFYIKIFCKKNVLVKIPKLFKIKKEIINNYVLLKKNINIFLLNLNLIKKYLSKDLKIISSIVNKIKYKNHKNISNSIKLLKILKIIPNTFFIYIKKIILKI